MTVLLCGGGRCKIQVLQVVLLQLMTVLLCSSTVNSLATLSGAGKYPLRHAYPANRSPSTEVHRFEAPPQAGASPYLEGNNYHDDYPYYDDYHYYDDYNDEVSKVKPHSAIRGSAQKYDLASFIDQFYLIKTPHGYLLGRSEEPEMDNFAPANNNNNPTLHGYEPYNAEMTLRERRKNGNFQLRVRKRSPEAIEKKMFQLRVRKNPLPPYGGSRFQSNFQLRIRKSDLPEARDDMTSAFQLPVRKDDPLLQDETDGGDLNLRVRKSKENPFPIDGSNFQLRVRKAPGFQHESGKGAKNNFQLRV